MHSFNAINFRKNSDLQEETVAARVTEEEQKITVWKP